MPAARLLQLAEEVDDVARRRLVCQVQVRRCFLHCKREDDRKKDDGRKVRADEISKDVFRDELDEHAVVNCVAERDLLEI